jgi:hypothetical protein
LIQKSLLFWILIGRVMQILLDEFSAKKNRPVAKR